MKNVYWIANTWAIGGVEEMLYQLAKKYKDYDLTYYYKNIDNDQLRRYKKYVRCVKYKGEKIVCDNFFCNYDISIIDNVEAKEYVEIIHADFKAQANQFKPHTHKKITKYVAVSTNSAKSFEELTGIKCEVHYNPIEFTEENKLLKLVSCQRLSKEKGGDRIVKLIDRLNFSGIPFIWLIFTNTPDYIHDKNVVFMKPRLDVKPFIKEADYSVLLSDCEGWSYQLYESLVLGTPVICTKLPSAYEMGVNDTNGIMLDFDMENIPIDKIYKHDFNFKYNPKDDKWDKLLAKGKSNYIAEEEKHMKVKITKKFYGVNEKIDFRVGDVIDTSLGRVTPERAKYFVEKQHAELIEDDVKVKAKPVIENNTEKQTKNKKKK